MSSSRPNAPPFIGVVVDNGVNRRVFKVDPVRLDSRSTVFAKIIGLNEHVPEGKIKVPVEIGSLNCDPELFKFYVEAVNNDTVDPAPFFACDTPQAAYDMVEEVLAMAVHFKDSKTMDVLGDLLVTLGIRDKDTVVPVILEWKKAMEELPEKDFEVTDYTICG